MSTAPEALARRRRELGLSQAELARQAGTSPTTIVRAETEGSPPLRLSTATKIGAVLRWAPDWPDRIERGEDPAVGVTEPDDEDIALVRAMLTDRIAAMPADEVRALARLVLDGQHRRAATEAMEAGQ